MLFIVFDIETCSSTRWRVRHARAGQVRAVAELVVFVALLVVAYVYVWKKGALEWR